MQGRAAGWTDGQTDHGQAEREGGRLPVQQPTRGGGATLPAGRSPTCRTFLGRRCSRPSGCGLCGERGGGSARPAAQTALGCLGPVLTAGGCHGDRDPGRSEPRPPCLPHAGGPWAVLLGWEQLGHGKRLGGDRKGLEVLGTCNVRWRDRRRRDKGASGQRPLLCHEGSRCEVREVPPSLDRAVRSQGLLLTPHLLSWHWAPALGVPECPLPATHRHFCPLSALLLEPPQPSLAAPVVPANEAVESWPLVPRQGRHWGPGRGEGLSPGVQALSRLRVRRKGTQVLSQGKGPPRPGLSSLPRDPS